MLKIMAANRPNKIVLTFLNLSFNLLEKYIAAIKEIIKIKTVKFAPWSK